MCYNDLKDNWGPPNEFFLTKPFVSWNEHKGYEEHSSKKRLGESVKLKTAFKVNSLHKNGAANQNDSCLRSRESKSIVLVYSESDSGSIKTYLYEPKLPPMEILVTIFKEIESVSHITCEANSIPNCFKLYVSGNHEEEDYAK